MADTLPIDQGDSRGARAELIPSAMLTPSIARLDVSLAQLDADLKVVAARRERAGLLAEQVRDMKYVNADSPVAPGFEDCPCSMCPPAGVTIPRPGAA